jgi:TPP-dependent indolepyruvate ferredoxin oxidoreductase alpha subunit
VVPTKSVEVEKPVEPSKEEPVAEIEPEIEPIMEPVIETPVTPKPKAEPKPVRNVAEELDFTDEEKALLDEKINQIIKKYNKKRHRKIFWTVFALTILGIVVLTAGYIALYYLYINPGNMPFGLPVLW